MVPTWDLVLLVFFAASVVYGFLMGKDKIMVTILGAYVGLVIANQWGARVFSLVSEESAVLNDSWIQGNLSVFIVKVVLFAIVLLIVALRGGLLTQITGNNGVMGMVMPLVYSVFSAALIAASVLDFLPEDTRRQVIEKSIIAAPLVAYYSWWLILPIVLMLITGWFSRE
ncbi:TPA: hypothetical protein DCR79_01760 [Patescibacteria group bacterium]|nr:hypothetical protein [Patescibacteria group bacterium]